MAIIVRKFAGPLDLNAFLSGRLRSSTEMLPGSPGLYLHGKTLVFTTPSATVTFAANPTAEQVPLTLAQVKSQIETQATGVTVQIVNQRLELFMATPGAIALAANGTANPILGFSSNTASTAAPLNAPGGSAPALISLFPESGAYTVVVNA